MGSALAIVGGEFLSSQRWYWAVLTCWVVFLNTASTGEILVKGYRRLLGTVLGVVAGALLASLVGSHTWTAFALVLLFIFAMFFTAPLSYALMSFFVTAMLGLLYTLLNTYGAGGARPTYRGDGARRHLWCHRGRPGAAGEHGPPYRRAAGHGFEAARGGHRCGGRPSSGGPAIELLDKARDLDTALDDLRSSTPAVDPPDHPAAGPPADRALSRGAPGDVRVPRAFPGGDGRAAALQQDRRGRSAG